MIRTAIAAAALLLAACAGPPPAPKAPAQPMEWRGATYTKCQDRIVEAQAFEASGQALPAPSSREERKAVLAYITNTELLSFGSSCGRGGPDGIGIFGLATETVPEDVTVQGGLAKDLYQDMRLHGHSPGVIRGFIDNGLFEEHMALRRLVE